MPLFITPDLVAALSDFIKSYLIRLNKTPAIKKLIAFIVNKILLL